MTTLTDEQIANLSDKWLTDNGWDYQKYGDKRPDRSAYNTMMYYEISNLLSWAFIDGYKEGAKWLKGETKLITPQKWKQIREALDFYNRNADCRSNNFFVCRCWFCKNDSTHRRALALVDQIEKESE
jgi:hypothetical protein